MGERRTVFDGIADSLIKRSHRHFAGNDGNLHMEVEVRPHRDMEKYMEHQPMCQWILNDSEVCDDAIIFVATYLPDKIKCTPSMEEDIASVLGVEYQECSKFHRFLKMVCAATLDDMNKNEGARFRKLIKDTDFLILSQIVGNEDIRDWMASRPRGVTVCDLEDAVVEAAILLITSVITQAVDGVEDYKRNPN